MLPCACPLRAKFHPGLARQWPGVTSGPPGEGCWMVDEVSRTDDDGGSGGMRSTPDGGGGGAERPLQQASSLQMSAFSQMARR
eukprot:scaffold296312_cov27-Tisochrysis_lutea.AAC.2